MGLSFTQSYNKDKKVVYPHFKYHLKNYNPIKIFCHTPCSVRHWNRDLKRVERGDKDYKLKNLNIDNLRIKLDGIINRYKSNDELLTPQRLGIEIQKIEKVKEAKSYSTLPLLTLVEGWEKEYLDKPNVSDATKLRTKSVIHHIKEYILEVERYKNETLLIDDIREQSFLIGFMNWLFSIPTINGKGLKPSSASRRFKYLQSFCKYYSNISKEYISIEIPSELSTAATIDRKEPPIFLNRKELSKLVGFTEFNFFEPITNEDGEIDWIESEQWKKHLTKDRQNRSKKIGVVEFLYENTRYGKQTYTSWEVYKDFLVFLCSVGCRYSDGINMKVGDRIHTKNNPNSPIKNGIDGYFRFYQKKTNTVATPRLNEVSFMIYSKYSRGKKSEDYLFPRTKLGNQMSSVKINKQIKQICKAIGLNRTITKRKLGSKGIEVSRERKYLWELVTTHIGRKTYIKTMVSDNNFTVKELMKMSGHSTDVVFHQYYAINEGDLLKKPSTPFLGEESDNTNKRIVNIPLPKNELSLKEKIIQLKELLDIGEMTEEEFEQKKKELIDSL